MRAVRETADPGVDHNLIERRVFIERAAISVQRSKNAEVYLLAQGLKPDVSWVTKCGFRKTGETILPNTLGVQCVAIQCDPAAVRAHDRPHRPGIDDPGCVR